MIKRIIKGISIAVFWIAVWALISLIVRREVLLPSPAATCKSLINLSLTSDFWLSCLYSFLRITSGIVIGTFSGVLLSALSVKFKIVGDVLSPILSIVRATPVASFIIIALVWIGKGNVPAFTAFLMILPVIWNSLTVAIEGIDRQLLEMAKVFRLDFISRLKNIYVPSVFPSFTAGLRTSIGLAWKAGIAAEVICHPKYGIGAALYDSKVYLDTADLFAWTSTVIIISMLIEALFDSFLKRQRKKGGKTHEG